MALTQITRDNQIKPGAAFNWVTNDASGKMSQSSVTASSAVATDSNGLPVASSTTAAELAGLHSLTANSIVATNGSGILTTITNPLTVSNGGTGLATLTAHAVILGEGTSNVAFAAPGTTAYPLVSNGASSDPSFQQLSLTAGVTGTLPIANGGTNSNAALTNGFVMASNGGKIVTNPASNALSMNGGQLNFVADPSAAQDAATKNYVDMAVNGLTWKSPVAAATAAVLSFSPTYANGSAGVGATLTASSNGVLIVDGYTVLLNDRILVKNQASAFQNGIYSVTTLGTGSVPYVLTRTTDSNTPLEVEAGTATFSVNGTVNSDLGFVQTATVTTIGTDALTYITFTSAVSSYFAGAGLDLVGSTFSISTDTSLTANAANSVPSLVVNFNATGGIFNSSGVALKIADNSLQTSGSGASVKVDPARAITTISAGIGVNVDNSTIDISGNAVEVKAGGITNTQVSASAAIASSKLAAAGATTQIQYNNGTTFAGDSDFTWTAASATLTILGTGVSSTPVISLGSSGASGQIKLNNQGEVTFYELASNGVTFVNIQAPNTVTSSYTLKLPAAQASGTQALQNDGSGNLSWASLLSTTLTSAHIFVGNGSNVATDTAMTGDVSITNAGVTSISSGLATHFVTREVPSGSINGSNVTFTLANTPVSGTECIYLNGLLQNVGGGNDYTISSGTITFNSAPESGSVLLVNYQK